MIKFELTPEQMDAIGPLLVSAFLDAQNNKPGLLFMQSNEQGNVKAEYIEHDLAVDIVAAKAGLSKPKKADREQIIRAWFAGREAENAGAR